jgi:hypothetical protein
MNGEQLLPVIWLKLLCSNEEVKLTSDPTDGSTRRFVQEVELQFLNENCPLINRKSEKSENNQIQKSYHELGRKMA